MNQLMRLLLEGWRQTGDVYPATTAAVPLIDMRRPGHVTRVVAIVPPGHAWSW